MRSSDTTWLHLCGLIKLVLRVDVDLDVNSARGTWVHALHMRVRIDAVQMRVQGAWAALTALNQDDIALVVKRLLHELHITSLDSCTGPLARQLALAPWASARLCREGPTRFTHAKIIASLGSGHACLWDDSFVEACLTSALSKCQARIQMWRHEVREVRRVHRCYARRKLSADLESHVRAVALAHDEGEVEGDVEGDQGGSQAGHQDGAAARQNGQDQRARQRRASH